MHDNRFLKVIELFFQSKVNLNLDFRSKKIIHFFFRFISGDSQNYNFERSLETEMHAVNAENEDIFRIEQFAARARCHGNGTLLELFMTNTGNWELFVPTMAKQSRFNFSFRREGTGKGLKMKTFFKTKM